MAESMPAYRESIHPPITVPGCTLPILTPIIHMPMERLTIGIIIGTDTNIGSATGGIPIEAGTEITTSHAARPRIGSGNLLLRSEAAISSL